jgi:hypothetical protein
MAARSKARVCGRSHAGIVGSNPAAGMDICLVGVVCCQVEVSVSGWSLVMGISIECRVSSECDHKGEAMTRNRAEAQEGKKIKIWINTVILLSDIWYCYYRICKVQVCVKNSFMGGGLDIVVSFYRF